MKTSVLLRLILLILPYNDVVTDWAFTQQLIDLRSIYTSKENDSKIQQFSSIDIEDKASGLQNLILGSVLSSLVGTLFCIAYTFTAVKAFREKKTSGTKAERILAAVDRTSNERLVKFKLLTTVLEDAAQIALSIASLQFIGSASEFLTLFNIVSSIFSFWIEWTSFIYAKFVKKNEENSSLFKFGVFFVFSIPPTLIFLGLVSLLQSSQDVCSNEQSLVTVESGEVFQVAGQCKEYSGVFLVANTSLEAIDLKWTTFYQGYLAIETNPELIEIQWTSSVISGNVFIQNNALLKTITFTSDPDAPGVLRIDGSYLLESDNYLTKENAQISVYFMGNPTLEQITFESYTVIELVHTQVWIDGNSRLASLPSFAESLKRITASDLHIRSTTITDLSFSRLDTIENVPVQDFILESLIQIENNPQLTRMSFQELKSLTGGTLIVANCPMMHSLEFANFQAISGSNTRLMLSYLNVLPEIVFPRLTSIAGYAVVILSTMSAVTIIDFPMLQQINGELSVSDMYGNSGVAIDFGMLVELQGNLWISNVPQLTLRIASLEYVRTDGNLKIQNIDTLTSEPFSFDSLTVIEGIVNIYDSSLPATLSFTNVESISGTLQLLRNVQMTTLDLGKKLSVFTGKLIIRDVKGLTAIRFSNRGVWEAAVVDGRILISGVSSSCLVVFDDPNGATLPCVK